MYCRSLYEEHRVLFATMLCINIQEESGEVFSEEEMSLLLQGMYTVQLHTHVSYDVDHID